MESRAQRLSEVVVVGGGWAGCAAAVVLAGHGVPVRLHEAAPALGGRARRVEIDGLPLDNGQHLLLAGCTALRRLLWAVHEHVVDAGLTRHALAFEPFGRRDTTALRLRAVRAPPPLDLLFGLLAARGLSWRDRFGTIAWFTRLRRAGFRCDPGQTVAQLLAPMPRRAATTLFGPLCVSALNTPPERASAQVFASVLARAFAGTRGASDFLVPALDLSELLPDAAARAIEAHGGSIHLSSSIRIATLGTMGVTLATRHGTQEVPDVVLAVAPHQLAAAFTGPSVSAGAVAPVLAQAKTWRYEPITTVYLGFAAPFAPPAHVTRLDDAPGQWAFDRHDILLRAPEAAQAIGIRALIAVVISADGEARAQETDTLAERIDAQLRRLRPELPSLVWSRVIRERRATYACEPGIERPRWGQLASHLYLAGDYTDPELPATLEAAVRSGEVAAHQLLRARGIEPARRDNPSRQQDEAPAERSPPPSNTR